MSRSPSKPGELDEVRRLVQHLKEMSHEQRVSYAMRRGPELLGALMELAEAMSFTGLVEQFDQRRDDEILAELARLISDSLLRESMGVTVSTQSCLIWVKHRCEGEVPETYEAQERLAKLKRKLDHLPLTARCEFTRYGSKYLRHIDLYELTPGQTPRRHRSEMVVSLDKVPGPLRRRLLEGDAQAAHTLF